MFSTFNFRDYDVVGFDLDNTLLQYNLTNLFKLQYSFLSKYLTEKKGYSSIALSGELTDKDADFIQRGLFLDLSRGNVLHLKNDGFIIKATHGTKLMSDVSVENTYGKNRIWSLITKYIDNKLLLWDSTETRTFLDFTDSIATLVFAKAIDSVDEAHQEKCEKYNVWPDVLEAIVEMYKTDSTYILTIASNLSTYTVNRDETIVEWLRTLKKQTKVILITGAEFEIAQVTAPLCLGPGFRELFDIIIYNAKKPGFFTLNRRFYSLDDKEVQDITLPGEYKYGNWEGIYESFRRHLQKEPKCVYIGDNPLQDIYAPTTIPLKLDTVAVIEEVAGEGLHPDVQNYPHKTYVCSEFWGPFLDGGLTILGDILKKSSKLIIPSIKIVANKPTDYEHKSILNHDR